MSAASAGEKELNFEQTVEAVQAITPLLVLQNESDQALVAVCPTLQGRVLTSTARGTQGRSYGWVNHDLIASKKHLEHFNPYGGEDRIWLGPEGGQYAIYFAPGTSFDLDNWYVPAPLDIEPFEVAEQSASHVRLTKKFRQVNYSGTEFEIGLNRVVRVLPAHQASSTLPAGLLQGVSTVAFESHNVLTNLGTQPWTREGGLLSLWIIGQFNASSSSTIVIPFQPGPEDKLGTPINTNYFAPLDDKRLRIFDGYACYKGDSRYRSKIGVNPHRVTGRLGSYDAEHNMLTMVEHSVNAPDAGYVNSEWQLQEHPYAGDVANCYNDGPAPNGNQLGAFYELESSSPAAALAPGATIEHTHRTLHFEGDKARLDAIARAAFGASLDEIASALPA
jgi:hypothetical protein